MPFESSKPTCSYHQSRPSHPKLLCVTDFSKRDLCWWLLWIPSCLMLTDVGEEAENLCLLLRHQKRASLQGPGLLPAHGCSCAAPGADLSHDR